MGQDWIREAIVLSHKNSPSTKNEPRLAFVPTFIQ